LAARRRKYYRAAPQDAAWWCAASPATTSFTPCWCIEGRTGHRTSRWQLDGRHLLVPLCRRTESDSSAMGSPARAGCATR